MPSPDSVSSLTLPSQATGTGIGLRFQLRVTETQPKLARADVGIDQFMPGGWYLQVRLDPAAQCPQKASLSLSTIALDSGKCPATMSSNTDLPRWFPSATCHQKLLVILILSLVSFKLSSVCFILWLDFGYIPWLCLPGHCLSPQMCLLCFANQPVGDGFPPEHVFVSGSSRWFFPHRPVLFLLSPPLHPRPINCFISVWAVLLLLLLYLILSPFSVVLVTKILGLLSSVNCLRFPVMVKPSLSGVSFCLIRVSLELWLPLFAPDGNSLQSRICTGRSLLKAMRHTGHVTADPTPRCGEAMGFGFPGDTFSQLCSEHR